MTFSSSYGQTSESRALLKKKKKLELDIIEVSQSKFFRWKSIEKSRQMLCFDKDCFSSVWVSDLILWDHMDMLPLHR